MEALGGFAIAGALIYGGWRVIETGATPGQFFSFLAAFMLAYEPAKRLARLNIDLNTGLVGVRILFEIIDTPPTEPQRRRQAGAEDHRGARRVQRRALRLSPGRDRHPRHDLRRRARQDDRAGRPVRRRQVHGVQPDAAVLRDRRRLDQHRRTEHRRRVAPLAARAGRLCRPGRVPVPRLGPREHRHRQAGRERGGDRRRRQGRARPRVRQRVPERLRHAGRRARRAAFRRRAPAHRDRARADQERADHPAGRGDRVARFRIRAAGAGRDDAALRGPHHHRHRPPAAHHHPRRPHPGGRERRDRRIRPPRRTAAQGRALRGVLPAPDQGRAGAGRRRSRSRRA